MVDAYADGADIVYGVRNNRETDSWFKRTTAQGYYKTLKLLGVELVPNHADFRLMSKRAVETFLQYPERNIFIRGLILSSASKLPKSSTSARRACGESKYPLKKMLAFAWTASPA
ncbi:Glycosyltransferase (plasmid) [Pediococcus damnosus]|uniref:Glycosyltransferase n=1 Tax=Pediococcus damnosus TaxID=51663 RepID=A0AAC9B413_9LACO|nr:Glycosyltransferase [Pediococcus damnosus]